MRIGYACRPMRPSVSLVTLGVRDVAAARAFYERLGLVASSASTAEVAFFQAGGAVLALWGREDLARDARVRAAGHGFAGVALAWNVGEKADVDAALARAADVGGTVVKAAEDTAWGGRSGYFRDPEGHLWEVAWNPGFPRDADGRVRVP